LICAHQRDHEGRNSTDFDGLTGAGDQGDSLIAITMTKPTLTSLKLADPALYETIGTLTPYLLLPYALSQALRRIT
jgi:hypothetical protein